MDKEKESASRTNERREDPILIALRYRWVQLPSGILVPEKIKK